MTNVVAFPEALAAQEHCILQQLVIQGLFLGHAPKQFLPDVGQRPTVEILRQVPASRVQLLLAERRARFAVRAPAIVRVDLDPVGAVPDLAAYDARHLLHKFLLIAVLDDIARKYGIES